MKRSLTIFAVAAFLVFATGAGADEHQYGWSISASNTDPMVNSGAATFGVRTLYLWFDCSTVDGMASAEFDIQATGIVHLATITQNNYLNAGGTSNLLLAVGLCPTGPVVAANLLVSDLPGELCMVPSATNELNVTVDCSPAPSTHQNTNAGYSSNATAPSCIDDLCSPVPVRFTSWGEIKGLYR